MKEVEKICELKYTCIASLFGVLMYTIALQMACRTIAFWHLNVDHRTLACHTIGVWRRPLEFGVTIALWGSTYLFSHILLKKKHVS
jgi:hypothetical protein